MTLTNEQKNIEKIFIKNYNEQIIKLISSNIFYKNIYLYINRCFNFNKYLDDNLIIIENDDPILKKICEEIINKYKILFMNIINDKHFLCLLNLFNKKKCCLIKIKNYLFKNINKIIFDFLFLKKYLPKTIALLNSSKTNNKSVPLTFNYYWDNYSEEFKKFSIIDIEGSLELTLINLDKYYSYGYRYFIGFSTSTITLGVLEWFNNHPYAVGISPSANSSDLNIPKNIFCLNPTNDYVFKTIENKIKNARRVYYIYTKGENVSLNGLTILNNFNPSINDLRTYESTLDNLTVDNLNIFFNDSNDQDILLLIELENTVYLNLYNNGLKFPGQQYNLLLALPSKITNEIAINELSNKYNVLLYEGVMTSLLWRKGYNNLYPDYSYTSLNILNLLNKLVYCKNIENINTHFGVVQFDEITKNILYPSFILKKFISGNYFNSILLQSDPLLGNYEAFFDNTETINIDIIERKNNKYCNPIALLELTNSSSNLDKYFQDSLYFYWYNDKSLPEFPIIDTEASNENTLSLLNKYYNEGYRIFLGFSKSSTLLYVIEWFKNHPDCVGLSITSTSSNLNYQKNIFRFDANDDLLINVLKPIILESTVLYYIFTEDETAAENVLNILKSIQNIELKYLAIKKDKSNLNVETLNNFFINSIETDVALIAIFGNQPYYDLYNDGLYFPGNQYDVITDKLPVINGISRDILNKKLFINSSVFVNTSLLYRKNLEFLTNKYNTITQSYSLINSLEMINKLLKGKSIDLLGSHLGILEFNKNNDIKYYSFLLRQYNKDTNTFDKYKLVFNDPLFGKFFSEFI